MLPLPARFGNNVPRETEVLFKDSISRGKNPITTVCESSVTLYDTEINMHELHCCNVSILSLYTFMEYLKTRPFFFCFFDARKFSWKEQHCILMNFR